jgi:hypothetical protein
MKSPYIPLPKCYSETIHFVVKSLLEKNPNLRASIDDILIIPLIAKRVIIRLFKQLVGERNSNG